MIITLSERSSATTSKTATPLLKAFTETESAPVFVISNAPSTIRSLSYSFFDSFIETDEAFLTVIFASSPILRSGLSHIITGVCPVTIVVEVTGVVVDKVEEVVVVVAVVVVVDEVVVVVVVVEVVVVVVTCFSSIGAMLGSPSPHQSQRSAVRYFSISAPADVHENTLS